VKYKSIKALREWKVIYEFDLQHEKSHYYYHLSGLYQNNLYGYHFLDYNFCFNDKNRFVISFPADTVLYESNLADYHKSYFARSQYQKLAISPVSKEVLENGEELKAYATRDSYGPVYFDPHRKYYLRLAKQKMSERNYMAKSGKRKQTVLILNENFKIIGESDFSNDISFDSLFFTDDGQMYARVNASDEYALHFIRLQYEQVNDKPLRLAKN
jgi:hypothetical protein